MKQMIEPIEITDDSNEGLWWSIGPHRRAPAFAPYRQFLKRLSDVTLGIAMLPILAPIIISLWALSRHGGQSGFYVQNRVGKGGRTFKCYKIRTMVTNAERLLEELCARDANIALEWHENQKLTNDPRITRIGEFLRATSLDELPQIWNVLRGDMSFVGPRPFMVEQEGLYRAAGGEAYFDLRPGISGLWQIRGRGTTSFAARVSFDNEYAQNITFLADLRLMLMTVRVVVNRTGQ